MTMPIVVIGMVGGAGSSLVACGVALSIADRSGSCLLVDIDAERGGLADAWGVPTSPGLDDLAGLDGKLRDHHLHAATFAHPSGVGLLAGPHPGPARFDAAELCESIGDLAATPLVIDAGSGLGANATSLAEWCRTVLVVPADLAGCRAARRFMEWHNGGSLEAPRLVVNTGSGRDALRPDAVARSVGLACAAVLVDSRHEAEEILGGARPGGRRARLGKAIDQLAADLMTGLPQVEIGRWR